ncbi:hypothetical protein CHCC14431_4306 [Bacillus licheniformis]|nr:hypothetical protein CHCC14431_4306 [Bacillus licheniformis]
MYHTRPGTLCWSLYTPVSNVLSTLTDIVGKGLIISGT